MANVDGKDSSPAELRYDWTDEVLDKAQRYEGTEYIAAVVRSIVAHSEKGKLDNSGISDPNRLVESVRRTMVPTWDLCWRIFQREIPLSSYFRREELSTAFTCAGAEALPVAVTAQLYFDYATFARNYDLLKPGLRALDAALPTGTSKEGFALFSAVEVLNSVHESCTLARSQSLGTEAIKVAGQAVVLPALNTLSAIEEAAVDEDTRLHEGKRSATVKALSYLMRTVELLPMPDSAAGKSIIKLDEFYRAILDQAVRSLHRDDRSDNGKSDVYFRCARVHHALGEIDQALEGLRHAISLVDDSNVYVTEQYYTFHRDLEQEQSIQKRVEARITAFDDVLANNLAESRKQIQAFAHEAANDTRREISGALFRVVEILGVFLALIGLLATTIGTAAFSEGSLGVRILLLVGGYVAVLSFFVVLRVIVRGSSLKDP